MKALSKRGKNWLLIITCVVAIYFTINIDLNRPNKQQRSDSKDSQPQWILSGAVIEDFGVDGNLSTRIFIHEAQFFEARDSIQLDTPRIEYYQGQTLNWQAQADSGIVQREANTLILHNNVLLQNKTNKQTISSQWLSSDFNKSLLKTDKAVTITTPNTRSTAIGMIGNWNTKTLALLNDVHVQITPNH